MIRAGVIGTVLIAVLYLVAGLFGYMQFSGILLSRMDSGSFLDLYEDKDYLIIASKIAILLTLIFSCPMNSLPARISLQSLLSNIKKALSILKEKACNEADNSIDLPMENDPKLEQEHPKNVNVTSTKNQIAIEVDAISSDCCYGDCDSSLKICELGSCDRLFCNTDDNELQMESTNKEESLKSSCSSNKIIESVQKQNQLTDGKSKKDKVEKACEDNKKNFQRTIISKGTFVSCVIGTCLVACASILAIFANRVNFVFDLIGSTAGVVVSFIAPALMYLHELKEERNRTELKITEILDISSETVCEHDHINAKKNRATECIEPEILSEQIIRSAKHKKGFGYILGWFVFWLGALLGLCSLALTIIFDTDLVKLVNW
ncbi:putative Transmembrane amino acid transporter protein [Monocercomonoides exilis]|uniref:putative Transmembrane amino acid transporter protein n=1 Tax=Monocercomonoides exilis TaxID=2049356 RepID=UPI00355A9AA5|nr:putative Transmembrane amino acid transporter protein [Monocercomonoides exilis]|eukprot:MONOS_9839.1-p1 / transcript=MONOS_9839.1 / gene=MONOS_9839 / organism=Monocercomonoides_exilis_PA203 / gene_product=unspecified product / transcript_product=unspecified product / location=Mono_scaffold00421:23900-25030(-) / protein_length=376 / sequence_SO=supercontig / SO=protein_coding / is_pseudo=false